MRTMIPSTMSAVSLIPVTVWAIAFLPVSASVTRSIMMTRADADFVKYP